VARVTYAEAAWSAIREEMRSNPTVFVMGQDIELDAAAAREEFGAARIRNTPISEAAFIGTGIGAALTGMHPVVELACSTFLYSAMDQVINQAAKYRYMFGGQASVPLVIRAPVCYLISYAAHHCDRPWGLFAHAPGLKIVIPTTPYDLKGLLKSAIRDGNPVLCFEDITLTAQCADIPDNDYTVPIGVADVKRSGADLTIVAVAGAVLHSLAAAEQLEQKGISAEVVDIRTLVPLDRDTILQSVIKTGRLIVVDPAPGMCGVASEIAALVAQEAMECLEAPIIRLTAPDLPVPFSPKLESLMYPTVETIVAAALTQSDKRWTSTRAEQLKSRRRKCTSLMEERNRDSASGSS
jgi:acetoin:2,6-dichlorophenolindophenol oxidoreductase subunit beta